MRKKFLASISLLMIAIGGLLAANPQPSYAAEDRPSVHWASAYNGESLSGEFQLAASAFRSDIVPSEIKIWCITLDGQPVTSNLALANGVRWSPLSTSSFNSPPGCYQGSNLNYGVLGFDSTSWIDGPHVISITVRDWYWKWSRLDSITVYTNNADIRSLNNLGEPTVSGSFTVGSKLTVSQESADPEISFSYQWLRDGIEIVGATSSVYLVTKADYLHRVSVEAIAHLRQVSSSLVSSGNVVLAVKSSEVVSLPQVSAGYDHTCAVNIFGVAHCWGSNAYGKSTVPVDLGEVTQVSAGHDHSCAVKLSGQVLCWGNDFGGNSTPPLDLGLVSQVSAGGNYTCAVTISKQLRCWGWNGQGNTSVPADLGQVAQVSAGYSHVCVVTSSGAVRCWGEDSYSHEVNIPWYLSYNYPMIEVSAGWHHTCAKSASGSIFCWGSNSDNQANIGLPSDIGQVAQISTGYNHTCALTQSGGFRCWGDRSYSQTDPKSSLPSLSQISAGMFHTCAVTTTREVRCWGANLWAGSGSGLTEIPTDFNLGQLKSTPVPVISGPVALGTTLLANPGSWEDGVNLSFRWLRDDEVISGETKRSYAIRNDDLNHQISIQVIGSKYGYKTVVQASVKLTVKLKKFTNLTKPKTTGQPQVGQTLRTRIASLGSGVIYTYQWQRNSSPIQNATDRFYELGQADLGSQITFTVCGSKANFETVCLVSVVSQPITIGRISKRPLPRLRFTSTKVGAVFEGRPGNWRQDIDTEFFWLRDGLPIPNAKNLVYTLTESDRGHFISFKVVARLSGYADVVSVTPEKKIP